MPFDIDPDAYAGLVRREVRSGERDGETTKIVVATRRYAAERADVWDAITNAERLPRWFLPVSGELRPGGRYQFEGNAGGVIERCEAPELVGATWEFAGGMSWIEVHLAPDGVDTLLELRHEARIDPHWDRFGPGAVGVGWDLALVGLGLHLDTGATLDAAEFTEWTVSEPGKRLVTRCSDGWTEAAIADGEDPEAARTAGAATTAFYTGAPEPDGSAQSPAE